MDAQCILHQVPLLSTQVTNLLNYIEPCVDPNMSARRAGISIESNGMRDALEKGVEHLLLADQVANNLGNKHKNVQVSGVTVQKKTRPTTGGPSLMLIRRIYVSSVPRERGVTEKVNFGRAKGNSGVPTKDNNYWTKT